MTYNRLSPFVVFLSLFFCCYQVIADPICNLDPLVSSHTFKGDAIVAGIPLHFVGHPSWTFVDQGSFVRITEKVAVELPVTSSILDNMSRSASFPNDDCDVTSSITGKYVTPRNPNLISHIDFTATKWTCPGFDIPCPTFSEPFRTCYQQLTKTIVGQGSGWFEATMQPSFSGDDISIDTKFSSAFNLSSGTSLGLAIFGGPTIGVLTPIVVNMQASAAAAKISYPPFAIPVSELQDNETSAPIQLQWNNTRVYFESYNATVAISRERYVDEPSHTACYMHRLFSKM